MTPPDKWSSVFFAYASQPPIRGEVIRETIGSLVERGVAAEG